jgi:hypothetical protein
MGSGRDEDGDEMFDSVEVDALGLPWDPQRQTPVEVAAYRKYLRSSTSDGEGRLSGSMANMWMAAEGITEKEEEEKGRLGRGGQSRLDGEF